MRSQPGRARDDQVVDSATAIIIPYYQREAGILKQAVGSALRQAGVDNAKIIVVDDGSPVPANEELTVELDQWPDKISIIRQENSGPAAARNKGLDSVPAGTEYVAFLDSDDVWAPSHLGKAIQALEKGYDFYFSDFYQLDQNISAFNRGKRIKLTDHNILLAEENIYIYVGNMFAQVISGNIIGTSTVVYRYRKYPQIRFREEFVNAGEDYLFWLDLCQVTNKFAFSATPECHYGRGVNIYSGSGWGTEKSMHRIHYELKYRIAIRRIYDLDNSLKETNNQKISYLRTAFGRDFFHRLSHRKKMDVRLLRDHLALDVWSFVYVLGKFITLILGSVSQNK